MNINVPSEPGKVTMYECPNCGYIFKPAQRCPECGQLVSECTSRHALLEILRSYLRMIENNGKEFPVSTLSDIEASIKYVLERNE